MLGLFCGIVLSIFLTAKHCGIDWSIVFVPLPFGIEKFFLSTVFNTLTWKWSFKAWTKYTMANIKVFLMNYLFVSWFWHPSNFNAISIWLSCLQGPEIVLTFLCRFIIYRRFLKNQPFRFRTKRIDPGMMKRIFHK